MSEKSTPERPRVLRPEQVRETLGVVPLLEAYFRRALGEMPAELRSVFDANRLTARHGAVLAQLAVEASLGVTELATRLGVSLSTASELAGDLSRAGLVERHEDPDNRRRTLLRLTDAYRPTVQGFVEVRAAPLLRVLERLSPRDRQGFAAGLAAWADEVRNW